MTAMNRSTGVALGDLDGDGDLDAFVVNTTSQPNRIYINKIDEGMGFIVADIVTGDDRYSHGVALADLDGDGDLDAFVVNTSGRTQPYLYQRREGEL